MARRTTHTLSATTARQVKQVIARTLSDGGGGGTRKGAPEGDGIVGMWVKTSDYDADGFRFSYALDLYPALLASTAIATGLAGVNSFELANTSSVKAGYAIVDLEEAECGDIIDVDRLPMGVWFQIVDIVYISGAKKLVISCRNDPIFKES